METDRLIPLTYTPLSHTSHNTHSHDTHSYDTHSYTLLHPSHSLTPLAHTLSPPLSQVEIGQTHPIVGISVLPSHDTYLSHPHTPSHPSLTPSHPPSHTPLTPLSGGDRPDTPHRRHLRPPCGRLRGTYLHHDMTCIE